MTVLLDPQVLDSSEPHAAAGWNTPFAWGCLGGGLMWMAFPPLGWWPLGWIAPLAWLVLIDRADLGSRRPYLQLYLAGLVMWLVLIQWIRLPHWSAYFGWFALSLYLAIYPPLFVATARVMRHRWNWPLAIAAPVAWMGLEFARGRLLSGFPLMLLGHSQLPWNAFVQIADLGGAYLVGGIMVGGSAAACSLARRPQRWAERLAAGAALCLVLASIGYGLWRTIKSPSETEPALSVALIQGSIDTTFDDQSHPRETHARYLQLSEQALRKNPKIDLIIWPESMYWQYDEPIPMTADEFSRLTPDDREQLAADMGDWTAQATAGRLQTHLFVGCPIYDQKEGEVARFNSVWHISPKGKRIARYDKMHPVMFGEYVPLGSVFPWLYRLTPMGDGLTAGLGPRAFEIGGVRFSPSICFENTLPHLIRRQVLTLQSQGRDPHLLVTVTNDGWFWGSSLLDHHLACGVFRAIEMRRPLLIAANTGFSAWIDAGGVVRAKGPRRAEGIVAAGVSATPAPATLYLRCGDVPSWLCLGLTCLAAGNALRRRPKTEPIATTDATDPPLAPLRRFI